MKLVTVTLTFDKSDLSGAVEILDTYAPIVREMMGCKSYEIYQSCGETAKAVIVQEWDDLVAFDAYRKSSAFSELGQELRALVVSAPETVIAMVDPV
jgi:quinol monooxygenase YgiN